MMSVKQTRLSVLAVAAVLLASAQSHAAIALDRTRVIFNGAEKSVSLNVSNLNKELPYLAQGWIEDQNGEKFRHRWWFCRRCSVLNRVIKVR
ncbi:fimbrial protein StfD [Klebsiella pneumoniae]|nr:fimbrial protein StfD [Klebsiella pneumoniae]